MRKYTLAASENKNNVDLRHYETVIYDAVQEVMPGATVTVE